jgi:flavin reductase (DIM6/NTAB) family NADH-FMN oxidoreductase RutF
MLKEGKNLRSHFLKPPTIGTDRFSGLETTLADNGCIVLTEALSYIECTVKNRMDCGDRWLLYAIVDNGKVLEASGMTAIDRRKSGNQY